MTDLSLSNKNKRILQRAIILMVMGFLLFLVSGLFLPTTAGASSEPQTKGTPTASPAPTPTFDPKRLDQPVVPEVRSQVDEGALIYWGVCMACHGDRGQGLTDEWRFGAFGEDGDCWQSGCHGKDYPPSGFEIPKKLTIPPLGTVGAMGRFENAQQLYDYVVKMMPWWKPNSLGPEKAWQVTAFLIKLKNGLPDGLILNETNASAIPVHRSITTPHDQLPAIYFFLGTLFLGMIGFIVRDYVTRREPASPDDLKPAPVKRPSFVAHLHPPSIPARQARFRYTLGAGGAAVFLCLVLVVTGLLEMFYYIPTTAKAAISVETIVNFVPFGALIRNLHYWSAQLLVIVALIHLARVIFTGAYGVQRKFNFLLGLGLFLFIVLLDFTGYILRWDEGIRWALTAGTNLLKSIPYIGEQIYILAMGGSQPGDATLVRFYSWHIFVLALAGGFFLVWHLFRVRRDGGIAVPPANQREETARISRYELLKREIIGMFIAGLVLVAFCTYFPAPLAPPIRESTMMNAESSAPWFFLWVQQLLKLGDPFLLGVLVPVAVVILLGALPYIFRNIQPNELGRWFPRGGRIVQIIFSLLGIAIIALTILSIYQAP
ncbi:MAG: cytochrome b N-terminal domain-containing protein [Anaerolineales bacterium]